MEPVTEYPVLLITTAVRVAPSVSARLKDYASRLEYTMEGLEQWLNLIPDLRIVVCDGSNVNLEPLIRKRWPNSRVEVLHFQNNTRKIARFGKGFGEGEIIRYALRKSKHLRNATEFMKCTGKLWVENVHDVLAQRSRPNNFTFRRRPNEHGVMTPFWTDTRFFVVETAFFRNHLASAYRDVDDAANHYIEHIYCERLMQVAKPRRFRFVVKPKIRGVSGSTGKRR